MSSAIVDRTVNSVSERMISLRNSECSRELGIGSSWNEIRIGIRCGIKPDGSHGNITLDNILYIGILDAGSKSIGRGDPNNVNHFVGIRSNRNWVYDSGNDLYKIGVSQSPEWKIEKIENGAITENDGETPVDEDVPVGAVPEKVLMLALDIQKGSPWSIQLRYDPASSNPSSVSNSDFSSKMIQANPFSQSVGSTLTVDEATHGNLVVPTVYWENQTTHWCEISDFYVSVLA